MGHEESRQKNDNIIPFEKGSLIAFLNQAEHGGPLTIILSFINTYYHMNHFVFVNKLFYTLSKEISQKQFKRIISKEQKLDINEVIFIHSHLKKEALILKFLKSVEYVSSYKYFLDMCSELRSLKKLSDDKFHFMKKKGFRKNVAYCVMHTNMRNMYFSYIERTLMNKYGKLFYYFKINFREFMKENNLDEKKYDEKDKETILKHSNNVFQKCELLKKAEELLLSLDEINMKELDYIKEICRIVIIEYKKDMEQLNILKKIFSIQK